MGLYLAVFDEETELDGVEVGSYSDFNDFRDQVISHLENGRAGEVFPTLILHSDCDGVWTPKECAILEKELAIIQEQFSSLPPFALKGAWQMEVEKLLGLSPSNLNECFYDVDGENLLDRLIELAKCSQRNKVPILFQ